MRIAVCDDDAMRFHVFRYLSKPLDIHRFFRNMKEAVSLYNTMTIKVPIETNQGVRTLSASAIMDFDHTLIHLLRGRQDITQRQDKYALLLVFGINQYNQKKIWNLQKCICSSKKRQTQPNTMPCCFPKTKT